MTEGQKTVTNHNQQIIPNWVKPAALSVFFIFIFIIFNPFKPNDGIKLDNEPENKFPEIFITAQDYQGFMKYMKESFSNWHRDISYVKKRMEKEGRIEKQTDIEFTEFLYDNGFST